MSESSVESETLFEAEVLGDLLEVVRRYDLATVVFYEHSGKRLSNEISEDDSLNPEVEALIRQSPGELENRFKMSLEAPGMRLRCDIGMVYQADADVQIADELLPRFISEIGLMAAYPYLRESMTTSAARLGKALPVLGILRRGEVTFGDREGQVEA